METKIKTAQQAIQSYFDNLEYKGSGYIEQLTSMIELKYSSQAIAKAQRIYLEEYFKKWLMASYLCSTNKSINDVMLILIGGQGLYKTTFLNYLIPEALKDYSLCSHINMDLKNRNTIEYLSTKFVINIDDQMESLFGKDFNRLRQILCSSEVPFRKLYDKKSTIYKRIANLCASTNSKNFLRRYINYNFLCFEINTINPKYIEIDIDALWAEVKVEYVLEKLGEKTFTIQDYINMAVHNQCLVNEDIEKELMYNLQFQFEKEA